MGQAESLPYRLSFAVATDFSVHFLFMEKINFEITENLHVFYMRKSKCI